MYKLFSFFTPIRSHHNSVHSPHGRSGHLRGSHRHHLSREDALLWLVSLSEETVRKWLLPDSGPRWGREDDNAAIWDDTETVKRGAEQQRHGDVFNNDGFDFIKHFLKVLKALYN